MPSTPKPARRDGTIEQRPVVQYDAVTKELIGEIFAKVPQRAKSAFKEGFFLASLHIGRLGKQIKSAQELRIFFHLLGLLEYDRDNMIEIGQDSIARELAMSRPNVALALKRLEERGFIMRRQRSAYQVSPELVWRGSSAGHREAINEYCAFRLWREAGVPDRDRKTIWTEWQA